MKLLSVKDVKSSSFGQPISARSIPEAIRMIAIAADEPKSALARFPSDYELWYIGDFDEISGNIEISLSHIASIASIIEEAKNG